MYTVEVCMKCYSCNLVGRFQSENVIDAVWDYIGDNPDNINYEICVCIDCRSEIGDIAAKQLLKNGSNEN